MQKITVPNSIAELAGVFCGCGEPDLAWATIQHYLEQFALVGNDWGKRTLKLETGEQYLLAYLLSNLDLTEHGSSICGAWITPAGQEALDFLRQYGPGWRDSEEFDFSDSHGFNVGGKV